MPRRRRLYRHGLKHRGHAEPARGEDDGELNFRFQIQPDKLGIHFYQLDARATDELKIPPLRRARPPFSTIAA